MNNKGKLVVTLEGVSCISISDIFSMVPAADFLTTEIDSIIN